MIGDFYLFLIVLCAALVGSFVLFDILKGNLDEWNTYVYILSLY